MTPRQPVELFSAFSWICHDCGATNFEPGITPEAERVRHMVSPESRAGVEGLTGDWLMRPARVWCADCGGGFDVEGESC